MKALFAARAVIASNLSTTMPVGAIEADGPHLDFAKRNAAAWSAENKEIVSILVRSMKKRR
jgi:hypothetical protein